ncbi:MAG: ComEC/Rec2 family competence protein [bacterium]
MNRSRIFLCLCLSFAGGIFLSSFVEIPQLLALSFLIPGILLISVFWPSPHRYASKLACEALRAGHHKKFVLVGFCILFFVLGIWRHQQAELRIANNELRKYNDLEQNITLIGIVSEEPDVREKSAKLTITLENGSREIKGKVLLTVWKYPEYQYGDKLKITGRLQSPQEFPEREEDKSSSSPFAIAREFNYKDYLAKEEIYSVVYYPEVEFINQNNGNPISIIYAAILKLKNKLRESIQQNLSPPQSAILGAMILGDKRQISEEWKEKLNYAGVRHLTAISGLHVALMSAVLMAFLLGVGVFRKYAFLLTLVLVAFFIIMTGLQTSAIRAGIMGGLFILAKYLGRQNASSRAIVFAAALMLAQNPLLLKSDIGFQLSFLAVMGIIYLMPSFQNWLRKIPNSFQLRNILAMTLSAQIFTLPILIYNFGYFSLIAPLTNVLLLPVLSFIMTLGFIFALSGIILLPLAWLLSLPVWLLLTYLVKVVDWFAKLPLAVFSLEISWLWLVLSYFVLGLITWRLQKREKLRFIIT